MTYEAFVLELDRLATGFAEVVSKERAQAFYEQFGDAKPPLLHEAVTQLLCERRFPSHEEFLVALQEAAKSAAHVHEPSRCGWRTHGRRCPLDWTWKATGAPYGLCPWHTRQDTLGALDEARLYEEFLAWCASVRRWTIACEDPALLWRILCGVEAGRVTPASWWAPPLPLPGGSGFRGDRAS